MQNIFNNAPVTTPQLMRADSAPFQKIAKLLTAMGDAQSAIRNIKPDPNAHITNDAYPAAPIQAQQQPAFPSASTQPQPVSFGFGPFPKRGGGLF